MSLDVTALSIRIESIGIREASNALGGLSTSAANSTKRIATFEAAMLKLNQAAKLSSTAMADYATKLQSQVNMMAALNTHAKGAAVSTSQLAAAMALLATSLNNLDMHSRKAAKSQEIYNVSMKEAHALARGLSGSLGALWITYGNLAGMAVGLAIGVSLKQIVVIGKDVEHTLEGIRVRGQETVESVNEMRKSILELGQGVFGPQEVAKAFDVLTLAGLRADQSLIGIKDALNLALVGDTSIDKAATVLVQVATALNYTAEGFGRIGDVISKTAAVSIASVDSISETFRAASVVGKLYGQGLVDIGVQTAILSNLKITGSAGGTSIKNFFSDLNSGTDKVTNGLKMLKLNIQDLKGPTGQFMSFLDVMKVLAGDTSKGFNSLNRSAQDVALAMITNERGSKLMVEGLSQVRKAGKETATALEDLFKKVDESWGFAAQGAAAMALTVDSQFKSVKNTLQTSFVKAFQDISPELSLVAVRLRAAFGSDEFINAISTLAQKVAQFTVFLVENAEAAGTLLKVFLAWKAITMVTGIIVAFAEGLLALKAAFDLAKISAIAFQASLGLLGIALAAGSALLVWWMTKRDEAAGNEKQRAALGYMDEFKKKLDEESDRLERQIKLMEAGKKAGDAYNETMTQQQLLKVKDQGRIAVEEASIERAKVWSGLNDRQRKDVFSFADTGVRPTDPEAMDALNQMNAVTKNLMKVKAEVLKIEQDTEKSLLRNVTLNKRSAELADAQTKAAAQVPEGVGGMPTKVDKGAERDSLNAELLAVQGRIDAVKRDLRYTEEDLQSKYKQGLIGEIALIKAKEAAEISAAATTITLLNEKLSKTEGKENKKAVTQEIQNAIAVKTEVEMEATRKSTNAQAEYYAKLDQDISKSIARSLEARGQYVDAYTASTQAKYDLETKHLISNIEAETDAVKKAKLESSLMSLVAAQDAGEQSAAVREAVHSYNLLHATIQNTIKGVQTASEGQGLAGMWEAATAATKAYKDSLVALKIEEDNIRALGAGGSDKDQTKYQEAVAKTKGLAETVKKMWSGVGESISESLEKAFGNAGKAIGDLLKITKDYSNLENKSGSARVKAYGDAAGAAKGFFKEGTKGYKLLENAEKAFRVMELIGMNKSLAATITNAAAKAVAWIPAVFMSFMASMGPWGTVAAGVAIAAVLGGAFGGGGGAGGPMSAADRQASAGAGSVLGDKDGKSESIANSLEILQKNSGLGLVHSSSMVKSLQTIADSIGNLSNLVLRTGGLKDGEVSGITEGHVTNTMASIFGKNVSPIIGELISKMFGTRTSIKDQGISVGSKSLGDVQSMGLSAQSYADVETKKKFFGITTSTKNSTVTGNLPQEVNDQFTKVVKSLGDAVTEAANGLGLGGDAFTQKLKTFVVDIGSISIKGLTGAEIDEQFQAIFSKLGDDMAKFAIDGLQQYQKIGEGYFETLARIANDLVQVKDVFAVLGQTFNTTGMNAITVSQSLIQAAGSLEKLTDGTKFFVDNFLSESERLAPIAASVKMRLKELGQEELTSMDLYKKKVLSLNLLNAEDQKLYAALIELAPAFKEVTQQVKDTISAADLLKKQRELDIQLQEALGNTLLATNMRRFDEIEALRLLSPALAETQMSIYRALDLAQKKSTGKANLEAAYQRESTALQSVIDKFKAFSESLKKFKDSLMMGELSTLSPEEKYKFAKDKFISTSALAAGGNENAIRDLESVSKEFLDASRGYNASTEAYAMDFEMVQKGLTSAIAASDVQTVIAQAQLDVMKQIYTSLVGIQNVMTFKDAAAQYSAAGGGSLGSGPQTSGADFASTIQGGGWSMSVIAAMNAASGATPVNGSHRNGLNRVPYDGYVAEMHAGERIQTAQAANASDQNSAELVVLTKELITRISKLEEHTAVSVGQRGSIAEVGMSQMDTLISKIEEVKRAVKSS